MNDATRIAITHLPSPPFSVSASAASAAPGPGLAAQPNSPADQPRSPPRSARSSNHRCITLSRPTSAPLPPPDRLRSPPPCRLGSLQCGIRSNQKKHRSATTALGLRPIQSCSVTRTGTSSAPRPATVYPGCWIGASIAVEVHPPFRAPSPPPTRDLRRRRSDDLDRLPDRCQLLKSRTSDFSPAPPAYSALSPTPTALPPSQAGSHPDQLTVNISFPTEHADAGPTTAPAIPAT